MIRLEAKEQYDWAVSRVEELLPLVKEDTLSSDPYFIELELLSNLVADYSEEHFRIGAPSLVDVINLRLYEMKLTKRQLAEIIGVSPSRISDYMNGRSEPTLSVARTISQKLNIDPSVVLGVSV
ncbi:MAG TPA: transcriptional regulator [Marinilabiliaceae bacterium]|nr:transcriptional regulator [Marinilabiliaceae bacterium]